MAGPEASTGDNALGTDAARARRGEPRFTRDADVPAAAPERTELARVIAERDQAAAELREALAGLRDVAAEGGRAAAELEEARRRENAVREQVDALRAEVELLRAELSGAPQKALAHELAPPEAPVVAQAPRSWSAAELRALALIAVIVAVTGLLT